MAELTLGLMEYFAFYNSERPHQSLGNRAPDEVYAAAVGGGARIPEHFGRGGSSAEALSGQHCSAAIEAMDIA